MVKAARLICSPKHVHSGFLFSHLIFVDSFRSILHFAAHVSQFQYFVGWRCPSLWLALNVGSVRVPSLGRFESLMSLSLHHYQSIFQSLNVFICVISRSRFQVYLCALDRDFIFEAHQSPPKACSVAWSGRHNTWANYCHGISEKNSLAARQ